MRGTGRQRKGHVLLYLKAVHFWASSWGGPAFWLLKTDGSQPLTTTPPSSLGRAPIALSPVLTLGSVHCTSRSLWTTRPTVRSVRTELWSILPLCHQGLAQGLTRSVFVKHEWVNVRERVCGLRKTKAIRGV